MYFPPGIWKHIKDYIGIDLDIWKKKISICLIEINNIRKYTYYSGTIHHNKGIKVTYLRHKNLKLIEYETYETY